MKRDTKRSRRASRNPAKGFIIILVMAGIFFTLAYRAADRKAPDPIESRNPTMAVAAKNIDNKPTKQPPTANAPSNARGFTVRIKTSEISDTHFLELVNVDYSLNEEPEDDTLASAWPGVPVLTTDVTLNKTAKSAVTAMLAAAGETADGPYYISSGYRNYAEQKKLYNGMADKSYVQPPGHSEHETGLAADIMVKGLTQYVMAVSADGKWLAENSWQYGLILRYPQNKVDVTGISYEPWHFRYIGQPHAWYCQQNNLCFEEYIQFLKDNGGYTAEIDGTNYTVLYEIPQNGIIYLPDSRNYNVSGDNTGGYIVTTWE